MSLRSAKTKVGLVYERPGNTDRARSHEEIARYEEDGLSTGVNRRESLQKGGPGHEYAWGLYFDE